MLLFRRKHLNGRCSSNSRYVWLTGYSPVLINGSSSNHAATCERHEQIETCVRLSTYLGAIAGGESATITATITKTTLQVTSYKKASGGGCLPQIRQSTTTSRGRLTTREAQNGSSAGTLTTNGKPRRARCYGFTVNVCTSPSFHLHCPNDELIV